MPSQRSSTTLAIVLGASKWIVAPKDFPGSQAFANAASDLEQYLCASELFGLSSENLLNLFDTEQHSSQIFLTMNNWIKQRLAKLREQGEVANTLLFYFVGHADFAVHGTLYCLAVQTSSREFLDVSGLPVRTLLQTFTKAASQLSQILIFDCCYAASAYQYQGSSAAQRAVEQAVSDTATVTGKGTYFLCSSGKEVESLIASDGSYPLFSKALLQVLRKGNPQKPDQPYLSVQEVAELTEKVLRNMPEEDIRIPEYTSTNRQRGDIADVPLFPNLAARISEDRQKRNSPDKTPKPEMHSSTQRDGDVIDVPFFPSPAVEAVETLVTIDPTITQHGPPGSVSLPSTSILKATSTATDIAYDTYVATNGIMFGFDAQHTHFNPFEHILTPINVPHLAVCWSASTGGPIDSSPVVANGKVYIGSKDGNLYAFNAMTGKRLWSASTAGPITSSPMVAQGIVYIGSADRSLYAFNGKTGTRLWSSSTQAPIIDASPVVAQGIVYIGSTDSHLYAFEAQTGRQVWAAPTGNREKNVPPDRVFTTPAVMNDVVYLSSYDHDLNTYDAQTGTLLWSVRTKDAIHSSPTVADGIVYFGSYDNKLYACDIKTHAVVWTFPAQQGGFSSSPAVANGVIYIGSLDHNIYALNAKTGTCLWQTSTTSLIHSSPTVANGVVYVGSFDSWFYALDAETGKILWSYKTKNNVQSSPTVVHGAVYVGSEDGSLYAFCLANTGQ